MSRGYITNVMGLLSNKTNKRTPMFRDFDHSDMENTMITVYPKHEQQYPTKLLPNRLEEYIIKDGSPTTNRAYAKLVTGSQVLDMVQELQTQLGLKNIDPRYYVGTCFHESGCLNEWDTEIATKSSPSGFQSVGPFQIGEEEARSFGGFQLDDMLELDKAVQCMILLAESNRTQIRGWAKMDPASSDPDYIDSNGVLWKGGAMRAYLAICHNHGLGYVKSTIQNYGLAWGAYKKRNPTDNIVSHSYGQDCITGGDRYPGPNSNKTPVGFRALKLTHPFMVGEDVRELQRHLKIAPDGIFGPNTEIALIAFQKVNNLKPDGICSTLTWTEVLQVQAT